MSEVVPAPVLKLEPNFIASVPARLLSTLREVGAGPVEARHVEHAVACGPTDLSLKAAVRKAAAARGG